jgi:hypothetical protein
MEAYAHGVSTRKVDVLGTVLRIERGVNKTEVSRICAKLDGVVPLHVSAASTTFASPRLSRRHRVP